MAMNINDSFRYMQDYRINDIPRVDAPKPEPAIAKENPDAAKPSVTIEPIEDRRPRSVDPNEVSLSFNKNNDFGYIGKDKDLSLLDMEQAISMMRQDSILQDYQYFVGSSKDIFNSEDGRVIATN
ncbi:MAG: hypothetical protein J6W58_10570 [Lachnospiraceae bacterium]|nr:hypothetical protein [Lachnospiraceae bacterium]MBP5746726.1 hypothetical protein [Lachnospiraceae bacterium]